MIVVLDASAALEIALDRAYGRHFKDILKTSDLVIAPDTYPSEIANAFWKYGTRGELPVDRCEKGIRYCLNLIDDYRWSKDLCGEVFAEAMRTRHPAYDLFYLVLARRNNAGILTRDKKIMHLAKEMRIQTWEKPKG